MALWSVLTVAGLFRRRASAAAGPPVSRSLFPGEEVVLIERKTVRAAPAALLAAGGRADMMFVRADGSDPRAALSPTN